MWLIIRNPSPSFIYFSSVEKVNLGCRKWPTKRGHAVFPGLVADHRDSFDVLEMFEVEFDIFPQRASCPSVKIFHLEQNPDLSVFIDPLFDLGINNS